MTSHWPLSSTMLGLWLEDRRLRLRDDLPVPTAAAGESLIRVLQAGICNTDVELTRGYYPFTGILGHEFIGVVQDGPEELRGRRVVGEINAACGACPECDAGQPRHCRDRTVLGILGRHGAFAEYLVLPHDNLHVVPDVVATDAATFTEPLAAALEIQEQVPVAPDDRVLVIGAGKLGQLIARTLALTRCELAVVGRHRGTLRLIEALGVPTYAPDTAPAGSFDLVVECTGDPSGFHQAVLAVRPRGTIVLKSTYAGALALDLSAVVVNELTLVGSRCGPFPRALRLLAEGALDVAPLIHARYPLGSALTAFEHAQQPGVLKVLLDMAGGGRQAT
jgi:threonine dehydrogenase-like Zn-dependent dehydrogenase